MPEEFPAAATDPPAIHPPRSPRHRIFADRVLAGDCLVAAYLTAGYRGTRTGVSSQAAKLRKRPEVDRYIRAVQARAADESTLTLTEIRRFLARIVRTPITALDPEAERNADLIKSMAKTTSSSRLEKLDPLKAIEMDLKLSGNDPGTNTIRQLADALAALGGNDPLPQDQL